MEGPGSRGAGSALPWTRILVGCALAFGVVLLIGFGLAIYGVYWAVNPGRQVPTMAVVGPDSVGVVRLDRAATDPGIQDLVQEAMMAIQRAQLDAERDTLPPFLEGMRRWQLAQPAVGLGMWLPGEATLSFERRGEDERTGYVAAVNFRQFVRPVRALLERTFGSDPKTRVLVHRETRILVQPGGSGLGFSGGTLLFAERARRLTAVLDRLAEGGDAPPAPLALPELSGRWDLYGTLDRPREARSFAAPLLGEDVPSGLSRARFGLDVQTADEAHGLADFEFESADLARSARPLFATALVDWRQRAKEEAGLDVSFDESLDGQRLRTEVRLSGLRAAIARWARTAMQHTTRPGEDRGGR